jgi:hypothetical protein
LSIKKRLIGGASTLALAGGMLAFAAPAAHAAVTTIGTCQNLLALGTAKSATINPSTGKPYGITDMDNLDGALGTKGVDPAVNKGTNLGTCSFPVNVAQGVPDSSKPVGLWANGTKTITKWGTKLYSREFDCNINDTSDTTEWSPSGALSLTFSDLNAQAKANSITAQVTVDGFAPPTPPNTSSDVVNFHGIVTKGAALGADVAGQTEFDPIVADKTQLTGTPYFGYQYDLANALGCQTPTVGDANITAFMNGSVAGKSQLLGNNVSGITFTKGV